MGVLNSVIHEGDHDRRPCPDDLPRLGKIDVGIRCPAGLARVVVMPLLPELGVVGESLVRDEHEVGLCQAYCRLAAQLRGQLVDPHWPRRLPTGRAGCASP